MRQLLGTLLIVIVLVAYARDASSAAIGSVVEQEGVTSVERQGEESDLEKGSEVEFMDTVKTGKGNLGITFIDDTNVAGFFNSLKEGLNAPLSGMSIAFSSSLLGLAGSLILGFVDLNLGQAQNKFTQTLEKTLKQSCIDYPSEEDCIVCCN